MKKVICVLLIFLMMTGTAYAEETILPVGEIMPISAGDAFDFDEDGVPETLEYEILRSEDGYDEGYRLKIGDSEVTADGWCMNEELYVLKLDDYTTPLLMVSDYGPSDDYETHFYLYENSSLLSAGTIASLPEGMRVRDGVITASVRGEILYTWFHDEDFALARALGEDGQISAAMHRIPRALYPMSLIVTMKTDLPLLVSQTNPDVSATVYTGEQVILCASDDVEWVYIESLETESAGWMQVNREMGFECIVGEELLFSDNVFDGLLFAD